MYATVAQAKQWVQPGSQTCDPAQLLRVVNTIRRNLFNFYQEMQLFADVVESYRVHRFCSDAMGRGEWFRGITLSRDAAGIESIWWNSFPVALRSSWREWQVGISPYCDCGMEKFDLPGYFSTFADMIPGQPKRLKFQCYRLEDVGKSLTLRGDGPAGAPSMEVVRLAMEPQLTAVPFSSIDHQGGVIKDVTAGRVALADEDGRMLGLYEPDETVPSYKRVKLSGIPDGCAVVNVRSARRYFPLSADDDVVETDNEPVWDAMARYLYIYERQGADLVEFKKAASYLVTAKQHLLGDKARELGKGTRAEISFASPGHMPIRTRLSSARPWGRGRW